MGKTEGLPRTNVGRPNDYSRANDVRDASAVMEYGE